MGGLFRDTPSEAIKIMGMGSLGISPERIVVKV